MMKELKCCLTFFLWIMLPAFAMAQVEDAFRIFKPDTLPHNKGKVKTVTYYQDAEKQRVQELTYDKEGRKIKEVFFLDQTGIPRTITEWTYQKDGSIVKYTHSEQLDHFDFSSSAMIQSFIWEKEVSTPLDSGMRLHAKYTLYKDNKVPDTVIAKCNSRADTIYLETHSDGKLRSTTSYRYDANGKCCEITVRSGNVTEEHLYDPETKTWKTGWCTGSCKDVNWQEELKDYAIVNGIILRPEMIRDKGRVTEIRYRSRRDDTTIKFRRLYTYNEAGQVTDDVLMMKGDTTEWSHFTYPAGTATKVGIHVDYRAWSSVKRTDTTDFGSKLIVTTYDAINDGEDVMKYMRQPELFIPQRARGADDKNRMVWNVRYDHKTGALEHTDTTYFDAQYRPIRSVACSYERKAGKDSCTWFRISVTNYLADSISYIRTTYGSLPTMTASNKMLFDPKTGQLLLMDSVRGDAKVYHSFSYDSLNRLTRNYQRSTGDGKDFHTWEQSRIYQGENLIGQKESYLSASGQVESWNSAQCIYVDGLPQKIEATDSQGRSTLLYSWVYSYY